MKKRIALALLGALLVMASVPTVAYAQEESTESTENTDTLTPDKKPATTITKQINEAKMSIRFWILMIHRKRNLQKKVL